MLRSPKKKRGKESESVKYFSLFELIISGFFPVFTASCERAHMELHARMHVYKRAAFTRVPPFLYISLVCDLIRGGEVGVFASVPAPITLHFFLLAWRRRRRRRTQGMGTTS